MSYDIGPKIGIEGETEFRNSINKINMTLKTLGTEMSKVSSEYDKNDRSAEAVSARNKVLNKQLETQKQKIEELKKGLAAATEKFGENERVTQGWQQALNAATADLNKMERELKSNTVAAKSYGDHIEKLGKSLKTIAGGAVKAAAVGIAAIATATTAAVAGAFKLAEKASDLSEAQNVVQQTFKSSSASVIEWTKSVQESAGISQANATKFVGSMGAMLKSSKVSESDAGKMAQTMVQLTGDMSSFYNLDHDTMWEKIRSGISGETEPLKQLGINMSVANLEAYALSQGINKSYKEMSQAEQTTLRYNYLLSVTKDAQGDFGRTLETSFPNQLRVAKMQLESMATSIGQKFLPAFLNIFKAVNDGFKTGNWDGVGTALSNGINSVINEVTKMIPSLSGAAVKVIGGMVSAIVTSIPQVAPSLTDAIVQLLMMLVQILIDNGPMLITAGMGAIMTLIAGIIDALPQIVDATIAIVMAIVMGLSDNLPKLVESAIKIILTLAMGLIKSLPKLIEAVPKIITSLVDAIVNNLPLLVDAAVKIIVALVTAIITNLPLLLKASVEIIFALARGIIGAFINLYSIGPKLLSALIKSFKEINWGQLGTNIIDGIVKGISSSGKKISNMLVGMAKNALNSAKEFLGIHSPSKVFEQQVGVQIGAGMAQGISKSSKQVNEAMGGLNRKLVGSLDISGGSSSGAANSGNGSVVVNVPLSLDGKIITNATSKVQLGFNRSHSRALGVVPV